MKKVFTVLLAMVFAVCAFGCAKENNESAPLKIYAPDGAPAFALSGVMNGTYDVEVVQSSMIGSQLISGAADLAIVPTNAAVNLFNKGIDYRIIASATRGNLYIMGATDNLADLKNQVVGVIGRGQTPDLVFRSLLEKSSMEYATSDTVVADKVAIRYFSDGPSVIAGLRNGLVSYGLLAEPLFTNALANPNFTDMKSMDVQQLYKTAAGSETYGFPQAVLVVKNTVYTARKAEVDAFINAYVAATEYAVQNPAEAVARVQASMTEGAEASIKSLTAETAERCNIVCARLTATDKADIADYIGMILSLEGDTDTSSVGGKLPDESIYILA